MSFAVFISFHRLSCCINFLSCSFHFAFMSFHVPSLCIKDTGLRKLVCSNRSGGYPPKRSRFCSYFVIVFVFRWVIVVKACAGWQCWGALEARSIVRSTLRNLPSCWMNFWGLLRVIQCQCHCSPAKWPSKVAKLCKCFRVLDSKTKVVSNFYHFFVVFSHRYLVSNLDL